MQKYDMSKGFDVIEDIGLEEILMDIPRTYRGVSAMSGAVLESDVFTCDKGIKQIQNLHNLPQYVDIAIQLMNNMGIKKYKILNMQYFIKHPDYKITAPHQDGAYFDSPNSKIYTLWIPLQDVTEFNSCMFYVPNSNESLVKHEAIGTNVRTRTGNTGLSQYTKEYDMSDFEPVPLKYGSLVMHDQFAVHYSSTNQSLIPRVALTCIVEVFDETENETETNKPMETNSEETAPKKVKYPKTGEIYSNYKDGGLYIVFNISELTTTKEKLVNCKSLIHGGHYSRPLSEWFEEVGKNRYETIYRFTLVPESVANMYKKMRKRIRKNFQ